MSSPPRTNAKFIAYYSTLYIYMCVYIEKHKIVQQTTNKHTHLIYKHIHIYIYIRKPIPMPLPLPGPLHWQRHQCNSFQPVPLHPWPITGEGIGACGCDKRPGPSWQRPTRSSPIGTQWSRAAGACAGSRGSAVEPLLHHAPSNPAKHPQSNCECK